VSVGDIHDQLEASGVEPHFSLFLPPRDTLLVLRAQGAGLSLTNDRHSRTSTRARGSSELLREIIQT